MNSNPFLVRLVNLYREAVNRVTDNIWLMYDFFTRELQVNRDDINNQFGIDESELDEMI